MTGPCRILTALSLMLVPMVASAQKSEATTSSRNTTGDLTLERLRILNEGEAERPYPTRHLLVRQDATARVQEFYVAGGVSTIIRVPSRVHGRATGIGGGGEQRFEVLIGDRKVIVTPTRALAEGERFPLLITLVDGTAIPLSLTSPPKGQHADGEVQIEKEPENSEQLRLQLAAMTQKAITLEDQLRQALEEQESADHQLAGLMAGGQWPLTAFADIQERPVVDDATRLIRVRTFAPHPDLETDTTKVVAVFMIKNNGTAPMQLSVGAVLRSPELEYVPFAARAKPAVISPGGQGNIAIVFDRASFARGDDSKIAVDFFSKAHGGQVEFSATLTSEDFETRKSSWWPF